MSIDNNINFNFTSKGSKAVQNNINGIISSMKLLTPKFNLLGFDPKKIMAATKGVDSFSAAMQKTLNINKQMSSLDPKKAGSFGGIEKGFSRANSNLQNTELSPNMKTGNLDAIVNKTIRLNSIQERTAKIVNMTKNKMSSLSMIMKTKLGTAIDKLTAKWKKYRTEQAKVKKARQESRRDMLMFNMSMLFGGMALQRFSGGMLRGLLTVFDNFENGTTKMGDSITGLRASFEFLKFSIVNSLDGTIIERFVIWLTDSFVKLANFFSSNPAFATKLVALFAGLFALGTSGMLWGQIMLFTNAWAGLYGEGGKLVTGMKSGPVLTKFGKIMSKLTKAAGFYLFIKGIDDLLEGDFLGFVSKAMVGLGAMFIPASKAGLRGVIGGFGAVLSLVDIATSDDVAWSGDWIAKRINTLVGAGMLFSYNPALGAIVFSAWAILEGIKSGAFSKAWSAIKQVYKGFFKGDEESRSELATTLDSPVLNLNSWFTSLGKTKKATDENITSSALLSKEYGNIDDQLVGHSVVPNTDLYTASLLGLQAQTTYNINQIKNQFIITLKLLDVSLISNKLNVDNLRKSIETLKSKTITITTIYKKVYKTVGKKD